MTKLLSTADVARRFDVAPMTVRRWCELGWLPGAYKEGEGYRATWRIPESALDGFEPPTRGRKFRPS